MLQLFNLDVKEEVQGIDPNTCQEQIFPVYSSANLYTLSWSSQLTYEFKADSCNIISRVRMGWAKLKPSFELGVCKSTVIELPPNYFSKILVLFLQVKELYGIRLSTKSHLNFIIRFVNFSKTKKCWLVVCRTGPLACLSPFAVVNWIRSLTSFLVFYASLITSKISQLKVRQMS